MTNEAKEFFAKSSNRFTNRDAQIIGPVLEELARERASLSAADIVESAKSSNSPLNAYFIWDDKKAADTQRFEVAHEMLRAVKVRVVYKNAVSRHPAAMRITVQREKRSNGSTQAILHNAINRRAADPETARNQRIARISRDDNYYPEDLDEAYEIIYELRARLNAMLNDDPDPASMNYGFTKYERELYKFLKNRGTVATKQQIMAAIYGSDEDAPEIKIVDVFVCKLRKKLPPTETIETVWGTGYRFVDASKLRKEVSA